jgi:hypothetical protein
MMGIQEKSIRFVLYGVALIACASGFYLNRDFYHDDAFITLRYVSNFLNGDGIVWNPGERVEGYTSFLFLVLVSGLGVGGVDLVIASRSVNFIAFVLLVVFAGAYLRSLSPSGSAKQNRIMQAAGFAFILTIYPMIVWSLGGLEAPLFTLFCTIGIWSFSSAVTSGFSNKNLVQSAGAFGLACMVRLDAMLFVVLSFGVLIWSTWKLPGSRIKRTLPFVIPLIFLLVPYFLWRLSYYGELLPNTFYVKAANPSFPMILVGLQYVLSYSLSPPFLFPILAIVLVRYRKSLDYRMSYIGCSILLYLMYVICVGGDHMVAFRFILPVIPSSVLLLYLALKHHLTHLNGWRGVALILLAPCLILLQIVWPDINAKRMDQAAFVGRAIGSYIATSWPEGSLVALNTAGSTPYYAPRHQYIDMLGLNDRHIARRQITSPKLPWQWIPGHAKGDGAYVLSRNPDYIIVGPAEGAKIDRPWFLSDLEMGQDLRFESSYEVVEVDVNVKHLTGHERYEPTRSGSLTFTYYKRIRS